MKIKDKTTVDVPDGLIDDLSNETEASVRDDYRLLVETIRRINVSPRVAAMGEAMKDDIRLALQRRITVSMRRMFRIRVASVAASIAVLLGVTSWLSYRYGYHRQVNIPVVETATPFGIQSSVVLSDGTKVRLNVGTTLSYPVTFVPGSREVTLCGEAFFEVSPDDRRPFVVHAETLDVRVLGTKFNVKAYPEEEVVAVTLESGRVEAGIEKQSVFHPLDEGEQLVFDKTRHTFRKGRVQTRHYSGWKDGEFYFESITFERIARQLERRFNVKIHIASESLKQTVFTGDFVRKESLNQILNVMTTDRRIHYTIEGDQVYIQ
jgi:ferric-dicitrate binding protein FerR (iron transport regulator)